MFNVDDICDKEVDKGQSGTGVKSPARDVGQDEHLSCQLLDKRRGVYTMRGMHLKSEIAQR